MQRGVQNVKGSPVAMTSNTETPVKRTAQTNAYLRQKNGITAPKMQEVGASHYFHKRPDRLLRCPHVASHTPTLSQ